MDRPTAGLRESTPMKDLIRIVLIDPNGESRDALRRLLGTIGAFWVAEVLESYRDAAARVGAIAPDLTIVVLDHDPQQAIELVGAVTHANPQADHPAGEPEQRQRADPPGDPRRGTRVPHPPRPADRAARDHRAAAPRPRGIAGVGDAQPPCRLGHGCLGRRGGDLRRRQPGRLPGRRQGPGDHPARLRHGLRLGRRGARHRDRITPSTPCSRTSSGSTRPCSSDR